MSGRTGKMTAEALEARGPRFVLATVYRIRRDGTQVSVGKIIFREDASPLNWDIRFAVISKSFTLRYLLKVGKFNE